MPLEPEDVTKIHILDKVFSKMQTEINSILKPTLCGLPNVSGTEAYYQSTGYINGEFCAEGSVLLKERWMGNKDVLYLVDIKNEIIIIHGDDQLNKLCFDCEDLAYESNIMIFPSMSVFNSITGRKMNNE